MTLTFVELFCGGGNVSREFEAAGYDVFSVDIRRRKGICEPTLQKDIMQLTRQDIPFNHVDVLWASIPCEVWSYAAGNLHWDEWGYPKTKKCMEHIALLKKSLALIEEIRPAFFFIEQPRGRMASCPILKAFLHRNKAVAKTITLGSYGFPTTKPTNIFTNCLHWKPRKCMPFGRGAKGSVKLDNLSTGKRQATPPALAKELVESLASPDVLPGLLKYVAVKA